MPVHSRKDSNCFHKTFTLKKEKNCVDKIHCDIPSLLFLLKNVFYILMEEAKKVQSMQQTRATWQRGSRRGSVGSSAPTPTRCSSSRAPCDSSLKVSEFIGSRRRWRFFERVSPQSDVLLCSRQGGGAMIRSCATKSFSGADRASEQRTKPT